MEREGKSKKAERSQGAANMNQSQTIYNQAAINIAAAVNFNLMGKVSSSPKQLVYLIALKEKGIKLSAHSV